MTGRRKLTMSLVLAPVIVTGLLVSAWAIDAGASSGQVVRNVNLAGRGVGGLTEDDLLEVVTQIAAGYGDTTVKITTPEDVYETTAGEIGLSVDEAATVESTLDVGRSDLLPIRPVGWLTSLVSDRDADLVFRVDGEKVRETVEKLEGDRRTSPIEPSLALVDDAVVAVPGEAGTGIDAQVLSSALEAGARNAGEGPVAISVIPGPIEPNIDDAQAETLAVQAAELTGEPLTVTVGDRSIELDPAAQRTWVGSAIGADGALELIFDPDKVQASLAEQTADFGVAAVEASFTIENGLPILHPSKTGTGCCSDESATKLIEALRAGNRTIELDLSVLEPELTTEEAEALGIVAEIGSPDEFGPTTQHKCCANRVINIHRIADLVRGAIVLPGDTFSINEYVGQRTIEKGFVEDGVIYNGRLTKDVGGGVSQFATTTFNAALFAGLDFGEYQSHSLYISRYPKGHEATISFPHPDLQIVNNTPFGVLIWPTYTETSITVHLYSTPSATVTLGPIRESRSGNCTTVTTPRTRTYPDGSTVDDSVFARYRPGEGVSC